MRYLNIQGLTTNIGKLKVLMESNQSTGVLLSETHITSDIADEEIMINNYNLFRCDSHSRHTGGVIIYLKKNVKYKLKSNISLNN